MPKKNEPDLSKVFSTNLKLITSFNDTDISELSQKTNITPKRFNEILKKNNPTLTEAKILAKALNYPLDNLLDPNFQIKTPNDCFIKKLKTIIEEKNLTQIALCHTINDWTKKNLNINKATDPTSINRLLKQNYNISLNLAVIISSTFELNLEDMIKK